MTMHRRLNSTFLPLQGLQGGGQVGRGFANDKSKRDKGPIPTPAPDVSPTFRGALVPPLPLWERVGERGRMPFETSFDYTRALLDARAGLRPFDSVQRKCPLSPALSHEGRGSKTRGSISPGPLLEGP